MSLWAIFILAVSVSIDAFAVSIGGALCSLPEKRFRNAFWAALFFGAFQVIMPVIGYFTATLLADIVQAVDHWLAFLLLGFVGGKMIYEALKKKAEEDCGCAPDFFAPKALFVPAVATSLDALAVGAGLAFAHTEIWAPAIAMGIVTAIASAVGVLAGKRLGNLAGEKIMLCLGGGAIILIGLKILIEHLMD